MRIFTECPKFELTKFFTYIRPMTYHKINSLGLSVGAQLTISDPSRTPVTLPGKVIKVKKIYTLKLTMRSEVSGSLRNRMVFWQLKHGCV